MIPRASAQERLTGPKRAWRIPSANARGARPRRLSRVSSVGQSRPSGHAVGTAQVAAVGERHAQVASHALKVSTSRAAARHTPLHLLPPERRKRTRQTCNPTPDLPGVRPRDTKRQRRDAHPSSSLRERRQCPAVTSSWTSTTEAAHEKRRLHKPWTRSR